jgi:hypothetical protein
MALIHVSYCLIDRPDVFNLLCGSFDKVEEVADEPWNKKKILRVMNDEVTEKDEIICPSIIELPGIKPFIISFDA